MMNSRSRFPVPPIFILLGFALFSFCLYLLLASSTSTPPPPPPPPHHPADDHHRLRHDPHYADKGNVEKPQKVAVAPAVDTHDNHKKPAKDGADKAKLVTDANGYTWKYPARAPDADVDSVYKQCGSLIPPKSDWWGDAGDEKGEERRRAGGRLPLVPIAHREDLGCLAELYGLKTGAELGVQAGLFSKDILARWKSCEKYILVDLWHKQERYDDTANVENNQQESLFQATKKRLAQHANITEFMRMYTTEAAKLVPDDSLDFIYVDARHDYCGVREDLREWWPKLRMGGILAGHDYLSAAEATKGGQSWRQCMDGSEGSGAVKGAVNEFVFANNLQLLSTYDGLWYSWYLQKLQ